MLDRCRNFSAEKVKHYQNDSARDWANRLISKLY